MTAAYVQDHAATAWEPRRQLTLEQARARSRFLKTWRRVCIGVSAGSALLVFGFAAYHSAGGTFGLKDELSEREALRMVNPRFIGRSAGGTPYTVTAAAAVRRSRTSPYVDLDRPTFTGEKGRTITAPKGIYRQDKLTLELSGDVVFLDKSGNRFETTHALIDGEADIASGLTPIQGSGALGVVRADAYEIVDGGRKVIMRGNVRGTVKGSR